MGLRDHEVGRALARQDAFLLPRRERPADGVQGRRRQFGDFATRQGERYFYAFFDPPPGVPARGTKWATVRSLADRSVVRVLPAHQLVTLAKYFARRVDVTGEEGHLCTDKLCARCPALFDAVRIEAARQQPPMVFANKWRELAGSVSVPEGLV